ncbi:MAG: hypothetical protein JW818_08915 [Pirellulales bacterium]|nr:hypothetical protein [Pirellulales bacterium]
MPGVIAAVILLPYLYREVDEQIRRKIEGLFAQHYPNLRIDVRSAVRVEGQGIEVRGVSILEPGAEDPRDAILHFDEVFLRCTTELADLVTDEICIEHVTVRRPVLRAVRRADGSWNVEPLFPLPKLSHRPPNVTFESGMIEVVDLTHDPPSSYVVRDFNATVTTIPLEGKDLYARELEGSARGDHLERIAFKGRFDPTTGKWSLGGTVDQLAISSELAASLPGPVAEQSSALGQFRAQADLTFRLDNDPSRSPAFQFDIKGNLTQGRLDDPRRLPYPLTDITATIRANNDGFALNEFSASLGPSTLGGTIHRAGFAPGSPWSVQGWVRQLELDAQLQAVLPGNLRKIWDKYSPAGRIDADVTLVSDGQEIQPQLLKAKILCHDLAFSYLKFPFLMEHAQGWMVIEDDVLTIRDMIAYSGNIPVTMSAEIRQPMTAGHGWFEARGQALPLDQKLYNALKANESSRKVFDMLAPAGFCDFWLRVNRDQPGATPTQQLVLIPNGCSIRYQGFSYPIRNIRGRIERFADGSWAFTDLTGTNDTGGIVCSGSMRQTPQGKLLSLTLTGANIPMDEELRGAFPQAMQQVWENVQPHGIFDLKKAQIDWLVGQAKPRIVVEATPRPETASIEPKAFPFKLSKLEGTLLYEDGSVRFDRFRGWHGPVQVSSNGYCRFLPDNSWQLHLGDITVDRLRLDRELVQALPARLRKGLVELNPRGPMRMEKGTFDVWHSGRADQPLRAAWDLTLGFQQASIDCGIRIENMYGELTLGGEYDGEHFYSQGNLDVESLTYRGYQFTDVKGPLWIDDNRVLFGTWVARRNGESRVPEGVHAQPMTGRLFGGTVTSDAWVSLEQVPRYSLWAELHGADMRLLAKETMAGRQDLAGRFGAQLNLRGKGRTLNGLQAKGSIWLREANIYQLPVMIAILQVLRKGEPDANAFSRVDLNYMINGKHIYLSPIKFTGNAFSLTGEGTMGFDSKIDLAFYAMIGRDEIHSPFRPLLGQAAQNTMTIKVGGTLQQPQTSKEVLPGVKEALRRLQEEIQAGGGGLPQDQPAGRLGARPRR